MQLDLTNLKIAKSQLLTREYDEKVRQIHKILHSEDHAAGTTWVHWPLNYDKKEFGKIKRLAKHIRENFDALLVVGIGGSYLGAKSGIDMLKKGKGVEVVFAGTSFDYVDLYEKLEHLKDKRVFVNVVSKSGTTVEILSTLSMVENFMKKKYGKDYRKNMVFTTDKNKGYLKKLSSEGFDCLVVPDDMGGRYSVLSAVGLLPFACAGLNIDKIMEGAKAAYNDLLEEKLENNLAYQYAVYRNLVNYKLDKKLEIFSTFSSKLSSFGAWLTQLFDESEGKDKKGLFVSSLVFSTDLHSVGQFIQEGSPILAETFIDVFAPLKNASVKGLRADSPIKFLEGKSFDEINRAAFLGTVKAHSEAGVPIAVLKIDEISEINYGYMVYFFEIACATSSYLQGVNPFNQPGVEQYKSYMKELLKK